MNLKEHNELVLLKEMEEILGNQLEVFTMRDLKDPYIVGKIAAYSEMLDMVKEKIWELEIRGRS
jgi:hypothetical protein